MTRLLLNLADYLASSGLDTPDSRLLATSIIFTSAVAVALLVYWILSRMVSGHVRRLVRYTEAKWDDILFNDSVLRSVWQLILVIILYATLPETLAFYLPAAVVVQSILKIVVILAIMMLIVHTIAAAFELFSSIDRYSDKSFKGLCQLLQLLVILGSIIIIVSILIGRDPLVVVSGLGAMAAVLMLVFQDTILGFIAGVQLTVNDMLRPGDWISAPKSNINGIVQEVTLTTVKIQNYDMTIVTIPPYTLVKDSFQNWRGMKDSGGRRVTRSFNIDMTTVRLMTSAEVERLASEPWFTDRFPEGIDSRPVNLTLFRRYLEWYVERIPSRTPEMLWMVRELQPTPEGLPVELYFFTTNQEWADFEATQADVLDEVLATVNRFGLRLFQRPTGADIRGRGE
ncbi:MAG: mechanosensitive ion channel family protein [Clostridium sp.]|nr:mechanosensitive ion channel family protein [Clostridium sp.]